MTERLYTQSILKKYIPPISSVLPWASVALAVLLTTTNLNAKVTKHSSTSTDLCPADSLTAKNYESVDDVMAEFESLSFAAEARIGNRKVGGAYEMDIHRIDPFKVFNKGQLDWSNGETKAFSITYDPNASGEDQYVYTLDGQTLRLDPNNPPKGNPFTSGFDGLWIYARGGTGNITASTIVDKLKLNNENVTNTIDIGYNEQIENMIIAGVDLYNGFTLSGDITFSWSDTKPKNSQLNVGFKLGKLSDCHIGSCEFEVTCHATQPDCEGNNGGGSINVEIDGGSGDYIFHWNNNDCTQNISNLDEGTYTVTVTDNATGCTASCSATIIEPTPIDGYCKKKPITCHGANDGSINVVVTDGDAPFTFEWSHGPTTEDVENLAPGSYTVTVYDANGCDASCTLILEEPELLEISCTATQPDCDGGNNSGSIDVTVSGGSGHYIFHWNNDACTEDISELEEGTYTVTVTDENGCSVTCSATIEQPTPFDITCTPTQNICDPNGSGSITVEVHGDNGPFSFLWSNGETSQTIDQLAPGQYSVTVTNDNGCESVCTTFIGAAIDKIYPVASTYDNCGSWCNGPYAFTMGPGDCYVAGDDLTFVEFVDGTALLAGSVIQDGNVGLLEVRFFDRTNEAPNGSPKYELCIDEGGEDWYYYPTFEGTFTHPDGSSITFIRRGPSFQLGMGGNLQEDGLGASGWFEFGEEGIGDMNFRLGDPVDPTVIDLVCTPSQNICEPDALASIDLTASGSGQPFTYEWSNGATTEDIDQLPAGEYTVTVTNSFGCSAICTSIIEATVQTIYKVESTYDNCGSWCKGPYAFTLGKNKCYIAGEDLTFTEYTNGTAILTGSVIQDDKIGQLLVYFFDRTEIAPSGSPEYHLCINEGGESWYYYPRFEGTFTAPDGSVIPFDRRGPSFQVGVGANLQEAVFGGSGWITYGPNEGKGDMNFRLSDPITPGSFDITCIPTQPDCIDSLGSIQVSVSGENTPFTFEWSNGETTQNISDLLEGTYSLTVTGADGCTAVCATTIEGSTPLSITCLPTNVDCANPAAGSIETSIEGGTAPFTFEWSNGESTQSINGLTEGIYSLTVTGADGCSAVCNSTIEGNASITLTCHPNNGDCTNPASGSIETTVEGGTAPFSYNWSNGASTSAINDLEAGVYTLTITDANGCTATCEAEITGPSELLFTTITQHISCFGLNDGSIDLEILTGNAPFTYVWNNGETTQDIQNLAPGVYIATVTDANGCQHICAATILDADEFTATCTPQDATCGDPNSGSINLQIDGGQAPYQILWSNGQTTQNISDLTEGTYSVTITDINGCEAVCEASVNAPTVPTVSCIPSQPLCDPNATGNIDLMVEGNAPFTFEWSNGEITQNIDNLIAGSYSVTVT
ncbi:MAG: SprB repeat-containing protein, partial [Bacteroidota bacterium]